MRLKRIYIPLKKMTPTEMAGLIMVALETNKCHWDEIAVILGKVKEATERSWSREPIQFKGEEIERYKQAVPKDSDTGFSQSL